MERKGPTPGYFSLSKYLGRATHQSSQDDSRIKVPGIIFLEVTMKCSLSINRVNTNFGQRYISLTVTDEASNIRFLEMKLTLDQFAEAVTGLFTTDIDAVVQKLQFVGKKKIIEHRVITYPGIQYSNDVLSKWLEENAQEEGWMVNSYLGSQGSVKRVGGDTQLRYTVYKYVDIEE